MATKKGSKSKSAKPPRNAVKTSPVKPAQTMAELRRQLAESAKDAQDCKRQLAEALEHQAATSEVLGIISRSPTDVQPVLDAIVESAARVCGIDDVVLRLVEATMMVPRAHFGPIPIGRDESVSMNHISAGLASTARSTSPTYGRRTISRRWVGRGLAHLLAAPLRQQGEFIGALNARRIEVRPFTPAQIKLLETFADQAVIAIENVRLFQELKESLEQQTATSEILGVIASSPTDIQPVLDAVMENAARLAKQGHIRRSKTSPSESSRITDRDPFKRRNTDPPERICLSGHAFLEGNPSYPRRSGSRKTSCFTSTVQSRRVCAH